MATKYEWVYDETTDRYVVGYWSRGRGDDRLWVTKSIHHSEASAAEEVARLTEIDKEKRSHHIFKAPWDLRVSDAAQHEALRGALSNLEKLRRERFGRDDELAQACRELLAKRRDANGGSRVSQFRFSVRPLSVPGHSLFVVENPGDSDPLPLVSLQMPTDLAKYLEEHLARAAR